MLQEYYADFSVINWASYVVHNFICLTGKHSIYIDTDKKLGGCYEIG